MGTVYAATHALLGTRHALKVLHDTENADRLLQEGRLQARLDSPNIVPVTDVLTYDGAFVLVMPLIDGCALDRVLAERRLSGGEVAAVFEQVLAGVAAAHAAGVVHRDLKPGNVLLEEKRGRVTVRVSDFGLALAPRGGRAAAGSRVLGTPAYAAPEQLGGHAVDAQSDLWSLGVLLHELLTGALPFRGDTLSDMIAAVTTGAWDPGVLPPSWRPVVGALLAPLGDRALLPLPEPPARLVAGEPLAEIVRQASLAHPQPPTAGVATWAGNAPTVAERPAHTGHLPPERDAFVGRRSALVALTRRFEAGARIVSVLGMGGTGKTRLAVRFGWQTVATWPGGVWFCDLSDARDANDIATAVATTLGVPLGKRDPTRQLADVLDARGRCLVVLDNFEQIACYAADTLGCWLDRAPDARFLVTSREVLGLPGEVSFPLDPLEDDDAAALFVARARDVDPRFALRPGERAALQQLVALLDGLPLAVELAAARVRIMSVSTLLRRMSDRFRLLVSTSGRRDRQATLRGALDWSWDLLSTDEQRALAQLSVFEGGFTLEAAEAVLALDALWAADAVQALVDKSLVRRLASRRFGMLVSVQAYAGLALDTLGERADTEARHFRWFASFGTDEAVDALDRHGGLARIHELLAERSNLVQACERARAAGDLAAATDVLDALWAVVRMKGPFAVAVGLAERLTDTPGLSDASRARVLRVRGRALETIGDGRSARPLLDEALALARRLGDLKLEGSLLRTLGILTFYAGDLEAARSFNQTALERFRAAGARALEAQALGGIAIVYQAANEIDAARRALAAAMAIYDEVGNRRFAASAHANLGTLEVDQGNLDQGISCYERALALHREVGNMRGEGITLGNLGSVLTTAGRTDQAVPLLEQALAIHEQVGNRRSAGVATATLGGLHLDLGHLDRARTLLTRARATSEAGKDPHTLGFVLCQLARIASLERGDESPMALLDEGITLLRGVGYAPTLGEALAVRAELLARAGDRVGAADQLAEAADIASEDSLYTRRAFERARAQLDA